jgi:hypothetical protein
VCLFQAMIWIVYIYLIWEVIVRFVDIGGIIDDHCLNFPFIALKHRIFREFQTKDNSSYIMPFSLPVCSMGLST